MADATPKNQINEILEERDRSRGIEMPQRCWFQPTTMFSYSNPKGDDVWAEMSRAEGVHISDRLDTFIWKGMCGDYHVGIDWGGNLGSGPTKEEAIEMATWMVDEMGIEELLSQKNALIAEYRECPFHMAENYQLDESGQERFRNFIGRKIFTVGPEREIVSQPNVLHGLLLYGVTPTIEAEDEEIWCRCPKCGFVDPASQFELSREVSAAFKENREKLNAIMDRYESITKRPDDHLPKITNCS